MKNRDRFIALVVVGVVVALIWIIGARIREQPAQLDGGDAPAVVVSAAEPVATDAAISANADAGADASGSAACRALDEAGRKVLDEARKTRPCTPDPDTSSLGCRTSGKGTWGFRVDDVFGDGSPTAQDKCGDTHYAVRLVHVDQGGAEESVFPGLTAMSFQAGTERVFSMNTGWRALRMSDASFFDYDGDGEDEVFVRTTLGTYDHVQEQRSTLFTFRPSAADAGADAAAGDAGAKTHIVPYPPAASLSIDTTRDADEDGRPDLLVTVGPASSPVGVRLLAHSLPDGTFSMRDAAAVTWAQKQCPQDPKLDLSTKTAADFGQKLADDIVCALLWGHDKDLAAGIAKACPRTAEVADVDAGVCPGWAKQLVGVRPAILLR